MTPQLSQHSNFMFSSNILGFSSIIQYNSSETFIINNSLKNENLKYFLNSSYSLPAIRLTEGKCDENFIIEDSVKDNESLLQSYLDYAKCRCRGRSQVYNEDQLNDDKQQFLQPSSKESSHIHYIREEMEETIHHQRQEKFTSQKMAEKKQEQDLSSYSYIKRNRIATGIETKNVTKNIGNLLFKFMWKNRRSLGLKMGVSEQKWKEFLEILTTWRKTSNITRQFLLTRWHGAGFQSSLFRRISNYYFRTRCLPDILKSNIGLKRVHYECIHRFQESIVDADGLSNIV